MQLPLALAAILGVAALPFAIRPSDDPLPWGLRPNGWRNDSAWHDGRAEKCVYEATRTIYGTERHFLATAYTNKQRMDPETTTKSPDSRGVEVFKHHWSERVPTENYDYDFSTCTFTRTGDLAPFKLTVATQEDCGASFKQIWRRESEGFYFLDSVYLPGAGIHRGTLEGGLHFMDELPLLLRDFPFDPDGAGVALRAVPSQRSTRHVPFQPVDVTVESRGRETLELPVGTVEAQRVVVLGPGAEERTYWFSAEERAPWLHALVRYEGPDGVTYRLRSIERTAYWERN